MSVTLAGTPVLQTERLTLRAPVAADYPAWEAFAVSDRARYIGGPYDLRQAWRGFGHTVGHWVLRGWGNFIVTLKGSDAPLGMVGPYYPRDWPEKEIGWTLWTAAAEGKGYAFEAARAALAHAFGALGWDTAVSYIDARNARSIALAERLGALRDPEAAPPGHAADVLVYRHTARSDAVPTRSRWISDNENEGPDDR
jgi:RimJ/RimL family protein N-acetyltransferase